eukprot:3336407-Pleurochrysis_carterae.AAC.5
MAGVAERAFCHGRRYAPVQLPHAHDEGLAPSPPAGGTRETNDAANAPLADDVIARPEQPRLANTPGMDSCSTPASAAAMHATPTPRMTRVTRTAHGNGARPHYRWLFGRTALRFYVVCVPSTPVCTAPLSAHCKDLRIYIH